MGLGGEREKKDMLEEVMREVRKEMKREIEDLRKMWVERFKGIEERVGTIKELLIEWQERGRETEREKLDSAEGTDRVSRRSMDSRRSCRSIRNDWSINSEGLSEKKLNSIKRMV